MPHRQIITAPNIIIVLTIFGYFIQTSIPNGSLWMGLNIFFLQNHLYYQVISTMFAHGGVEHLLMNMLVLWQIGNLLNHYIGTFRFLILYFIGGILTSIGTLGYMYYFNQWANVIGASGAISVLIGYMALKDKSQRSGLLVWIFLISFIPLFLGMPVAWYAHCIGFIIGWIIGYLI